MRRTSGEVNDIFPRTKNILFCLKLSSGDFSCLKVKLHFTRDKAFYWTTVFIPGDANVVLKKPELIKRTFMIGIILVTSSFVTFWIEWNAVPARVMLGVTTMLNFFTTSNGFRSNLPVRQLKLDQAKLEGYCAPLRIAEVVYGVCADLYRSLKRRLWIRRWS